MQPIVPVNPDRHTAESSKGCAGLKEHDTKSMKLIFEILRVKSLHKGRSASCIPYPICWYATWNFISGMYQRFIQTTPLMRWYSFSIASVRQALTAPELDLLVCSSQTVSATATEATYPAHWNKSSVVLRHDSAIFKIVSFQPGERRLNRHAPWSCKRRHAAVDVRAAAVESALLCTHVHPEGVEGAAVQAHAVAALALSDPSGGRLSPLSTPILTLFSHLPGAPEAARGHAIGSTDTSATTSAETSALGAVLVRPGCGCGCVYLCHRLATGILLHQTYLTLMHCRRSSLSRQPGHSRAPSLHLVLDSAPDPPVKKTDGVLVHTASQPPARVL